MHFLLDETQDRILLQLQKMGLPFEDYYFESYEGRLYRIGEGGMGTVYRAMKKPVACGANEYYYNEYAVKVTGFKDDHLDTADFYSVAKLQGRLSREANVVKIIEFTEIEVRLDGEGRVAEAKITEPKKMKARQADESALRLQFLLMKKLKPLVTRDSNGNFRVSNGYFRISKDLSGWIGIDDFFRVAYDIGSALKKVHEEGLLHRDVKLENIFYDERKKVYLLGDFGIAKAPTDGYASTRVFTNGCAAPEVMKGRSKYDKTADIYSYGMMLYMLLNKLKPLELSRQYAQGFVLPWPEALKEQRSLYLMLKECGIEREVDAKSLYDAVSKMCSYDPADRFQSMGEALGAIEALMWDEQFTRRRRACSQKRPVVLVCWLFGALCIGGVLFPGAGSGFSPSAYIYFSLIIGCALLKRMRKQLKKEFQNNKYLDGLIRAYRIVCLCFGLFLACLSEFSWAMAFAAAAAVAFTDTAFFVCVTLLVFKLAGAWAVLNPKFTSGVTSDQLWFPLFFIAGAVAFCLHARKFSGIERKNYKKRKEAIEKNRVYEWFAALLLVGAVCFLCDGLMGGSAVIASMGRESILYQFVGVAMAGVFLDYLFNAEEPEPNAGK